MTLPVIDLTGSEEGMVRRLIAPRALPVLGQLVAVQLCPLADQRTRLSVNRLGNVGGPSSGDAARKRSSPASDQVPRRTGLWLIGS